MSESLRILVIEDDPSISEVVRAHLTRQGHCCVGAFSGTEGMLHLEHGDGSVAFDLVITDLMLPGMTGEDVVGRIRAASATLPIIVISARITPADKVMLLTLGADDYLTKPFSVDELLARVRVALRRLAYNPGALSQQPPATYRNGPLAIDYDAGVATLAGEELHLTPIEYKLLALLAKNTGKVLTHNFILKEVWGSALASDLPSLRVFMATLRKKIEPTADSPRFVQTHVGIGYRMLQVDAPES